MKKYLILVCLLLFSVISIAQQGENDVAPNRRWTAKKANQWYAERPWFVGCNFIPSTAINQLEMWQPDTFDPDTIDKELGWAAGIGMNSARVYLHDLLWTQDSIGFIERIDMFLDICKKHGIKPMFVLFDSCWNPHPKLGKQPEPKPHVHNSGWVQSPHIDMIKNPERIDSLKPYVKGILERFKHDHRILLWDLYNEPGNKQEDHESLVLLKKAFAWARQVNPSQPLTAGLWKGDWQKDKLSELNQYMLDNSDVITFHAYHGLDKTKTKVENLKPYGRPLLCTEYMARTAGSTFADHLPYFKKHNIGAYNWGLVAGKTQTQYPWKSWRETFTKEPDVWFHDIFRPDGTPYDQAEVDLIKRLTAPGQEAPLTSSDLTYLRALMSLSPPPVILKSVYTKTAG